MVRLGERRAAVGMRNIVETAREHISGSNEIEY